MLISKARYVNSMRRYNKIGTLSSMYLIKYNVNTYIYKYKYIKYSVNTYINVSVYTILDQVIA